MPVSSIASLRRTEASSQADRLVAGRTGTVIAALMLTVLLTSFRPFQPDVGMGLTNGDVVNQIGFSLLGVVSLGCFAMLIRPRRAVMLWGPWMLLLFGFFCFSVAHALDPSSAVRAASITLIGVLALGVVLTLPRDADDFCAVIGFAAAAVLIVSYAGLLVLPDVAKHTADAVEPEHAGLWRGVFSHKNIAGPVMACLSFSGVFLFRQGWRRLGGAIFLAALIFVANTGSKTTAGLVPLSILIVILPGLLGLRGVTVFLVVAALLGTALGTLGIVFLAPLKQLASQHFPDLTYTGRTTLWEYAGEMIAKRPWAGYGFDSFWGTPWIQQEEQPFDRAWDIRGIVHGHDGYVDIALTMGLPALGVAVIAFLVEPLRDYLRTPPLPANIRMADFFLMTVLFTTLNAFLESFFFRRADPVWLCFMLGVMGLRLSARLPFKQHAVLLTEAETP